MESQKNNIENKNAELEKAQKVIQEKAAELELTSKYKSEFLANMSHELRTPLNSLLILSKFLADNKESNLTEKQVEFANTINAAGGDLLSLINDILDISKVESGKMVRHVENVLLNEFPSNIKRTFMPMVQQKDLTLDIDLENGLPDHIQTDIQRVNQIIKNLLSNAIKFTHKGGITIKINRPQKDSNLLISGMKHEEAIAISISDTGIGIPKAKQKVIFEAFQQADGSTNRKYGGTGLGLSISRELAKFLGGEIQMQSEEGKGSTFILYLPETISDKQESDSDKQESEPKETSEKNIPTSPVEQPTETDRADLQPQTELPTGLETIRDDRREIQPDDKTILIVEDDPNFAKILFDLVHEKGYKCLVAGDGETGLQFADYYQPVAIILDVSLPGIDGWTVMERLKGNSKTQKIPVHFITASEGNIEALRMGAIGFLTKPVSMELLEGAFKKIEDVVSKRIKNLLIIEDDEAQKDDILKLINSEDISITVASTDQEAYDYINSGEFDCMILDPLFADKSGFDLLEKAKKNRIIGRIPIIIYSPKELSKEEETKLNEYSKNIVIKEVKSPEELLDECVLFLHLIEENLPNAEQNERKMTHDKESVFEGKKLLIVDDDIRNVFALTSVLEEKGLEIGVAKNGRESLEYLEKNPDIDLVLMDIMMPEMDGYEATRRIRKQRRFEDLPIITLTAKAMVGDRNKCIEAGATDYIAKPVETDKLLSILRVWLYKSN